MEEYKEMGDEAYDQFFDHAEYTFSFVRKHYNPNKKHTVTKFNIFFDKLVRHVAGKRRWNDKIKSTMTIQDSNMVTVTDEAFTIVAIENYYNQWESNRKDVGTKWTDVKSGNLLYQGWKNEGIDRFHELCEEIEKERQTERSKEAETSFMYKMRAKYMDLGELKNGPGEGDEGKDDDSNDGQRKERPRVYSELHKMK